MNDFLSAFRDALFGLRSTDRPVEKYCSEIRQGFAARRANLENHVSKAEAEREIQIKALERAKDGRLRAVRRERDILKTRLSKKSERLHQNRSPLYQAREEFDLASIAYQDWRKAVGRPPYAERYQSLLEEIRLRFSSNKDGGQIKANTNDNKNDNEGSISRFFNFVFAQIGFILVPFDVYYTYPGFLAILDDSNFAIGVAILFSLILLSLGAALPTLIRFMRSRRLGEHNMIESSWSRGYVIIFTSVIIITFVTIYAGTTIRSIVPEAASLSTEKSRIDIEMERLIELNRNGGGDITDEIDSLKSKITLLENTQRELKGRFVPYLSADTALALAFYSMIVLSTMISRLVRTDPIFEYYLAFEQKAITQRAVMYLEHSIAETLESDEAAIQEKELEEELIEADLSEEAVLKAESEIRTARNAIDVQQSFMEETVRLRSLRYAKAFRRLTGSPEVLKEWEQLFEEQNSNQEKVEA